ncbi:rhamnogalacturonan acetylesterase [Paenibacillus sp. TRM 82003]|uniref:rhamnogalacturonan acetylesterase n=1 Tax=Kineococcus sp. TRM81007 TaxID=2925831 RepID=UPI001F5AC31E|nr:rhamnogalacturonan acetylesterase [Kineococcus sp. TRM81007]MCI2238236.1 rhamnogalacturonan acetylesterase [Kineococcus sp. TRM81007]MCI3924092.1 rhamnogalacturonan acetylesterase [Paenibacillus sp. TRM 82003]
MPRTDRGTSTPGARDARPRRPLRSAATAAAALLGAASIVASGPASAAGPEDGRGYRPAPQPDRALLSACTGEAPVVCTYDLPPGHYDVTVLLGSRREAAATRVLTEARRLLSEQVDTGPGQLVRRTWTVDVRTPEGQQNSSPDRGEPGLTLTFDGPAPAVAGIGIAAAPERSTTRLFLMGDSTVTDQEDPPYTGWGQHLPRSFRHGVSVVNHSGSGESTVSVLADPRMFASLVPQLRRGDAVLVQLAHNDKGTTAEQYRRNLTTIVEQVRARGATPVLVTPIVRHRFTGDQLNPTGLIVNGLGVDLPAEVRATAAELDVDLVDLTAMSEGLVEGLGRVESETLYLYRVNGDRTHTSEHGATVYSALVAGALRDLGLVPDRYWATP